MSLSSLINTHYLSIAETLKNVRGNDKIKSALQKLDQLTGVESSMVLAHVYKCAMEGAHGLLV